MNPVNKTFMIFVRSDIETSVHKEKKKIIQGKYCTIWINIHIHDD